MTNMKMRMGLLLVASALPVMGWADSEYVVIPKGGSVAQFGVSSLAGAPAVLSAERVFSKANAEFLIRSQKGGIARSVKVKLKDDEALQTFKRWLKDRGIDAHVESSRIPSGLNEVKVPEQGSRSSDDRYLADQWGLKNTGQTVEIPLSDIHVRTVKGVPGEDVGIERAPRENPANPVIVAVLDSGVDVNHPDLKDRIFRDERECEGIKSYQSCLSSGTEPQECHDRWATYDPNGNGHPLDCNGWNTTGKENERTGVHGDNDPSDGHGHGTHVAGIVAAKADQLGVRGVSESALILPVKVKQGDEGTEAIARGILYAVRTGARIINMSLEWSLANDSVLMHEMTDLARMNDVLLVTGAGNLGHDVPTYPCQYEGVICVGSHNVDGSMSFFSGYGAAVDLVAPGDQILSTYPTNLNPKNFTERRGWEILSGTSMAAPHVSGALARLLNAGYSSEDAYARLFVGARPRLAGETHYTMGGRIDLGRSFKVKEQPLILPSVKGGALISWKTGEDSQNLKIRLKNFWKSARNAQVSVRLVPKPGREQVSISRSSFTVNDWAAGSEKALDIALTGTSRLGDLTDSRFEFEVAVTADGAEVRQFKVQAEAIRLVDSYFQAPGVRHSKLVPEELGARIAGAWMKPFQNLTESEGKDFAAVLTRGSSAAAFLLKDRGSHYEIKGPLLLEVPDPRIVNLSRLDLDRDGQAEYVITAYVEDEKEKGRYNARFWIFDEAMNVKDWSVVTMNDKEGNPQKNFYDNSVMPIHPRFRGTMIGGRMVPAWPSFGRLPDAEVSPSDPWKPDPTPKPAPKHRLYYLTEQGLRSITLDESQNEGPIAILQSTWEELKNGDLTLLTAKGKGFVLDFGTAKLVNSSEGPKLVREQKLELPDYHNLVGILPLGALTSDPSVKASMFAEPGSEGSMLFTVIQRNAQGGLSSQQHRVPPMKEFQSIRDSLGFHAFSDRGGTMVFQSQFEIGLHSTATGRTLSTPLRTTHPERVHIVLPVKGRSGEVLPGAFLEQKQAAGLSGELIVADQDQLIRPIRFRLLGVDGCEEAAVDISQKSGESSVHYFCGSSMIEIPLTLDR